MLCRLLDRLLVVLRIISAIIICLPIIIVTLSCVGIVMLIDIPIYLLTGKHAIRLEISNNKDDE